MGSGFGVTHLRCRQCGSELPVMGRAVVFRCGSCGSRWILDGGGLERAAVFYAEPPGAFDGEPVILPFWVIRAAGAGFARKSGGETDPWRASDVSSELGHLLSAIDKRGDFRIFVPAFTTVNPHAYIKVGRLMTRAQPVYAAARSDNNLPSVPCMLQRAQALMLADYIFISSLPSQVLGGGDRIEALRVRPAAGPRLVEFPFGENGAYLMSLHCGFQISRSLIEAPSRIHSEQLL